jgi:fructokinase
LVAAGARLVVLTLGAAGAILRGELRADVPGVRVARLVSTVGAGDAVAAGALACERLGALD